MLILLLVTACGTPPLPASGEQTTETFRSDIQDDDFLLRIRVPAEPAGPLVIQLDPTFAGLQQMEHTVGILSQHEAEDDWPGTVVVGIDYEQPGTRFRDYTPALPLDPTFAPDEDGADRFYAVLRDELLPHLVDTLPVDPERVILQGHSNGGIFSLYAAFRHETSPLFAAHIAADFGVDEAMFTLERWHAEREDDLPIRLFTSRATVNGPLQELTVTKLLERIDTRAYPSLVREHVELATDHGGAVVPTYESGLAFALQVAP